MTSRKRSGEFDIVINNTGVSFGKGTSYADSDSFSWGAFRVDALLKDTFWHQELQGRPLPFALQIVPSKEQTVLFSDVHGPVYATFQPAYDDQGEKVPKEIMMTISIHANEDGWRKESKDAYKAIKQQITDAMFEEIQKVINIKDYLIYEESGTPLTYKKYMGKTSVGGFPLTVRNAITKPKSVRSPLPQLYIVGEQAFPGPGTLSSALSGYHAARAIMHTYHLK